MFNDSAFYACAYAGTLELRRVLHRDNPAHQALLDAEVIACGGVPDQAQDRGIKRERCGGSAAGRAVDLTGFGHRRSCDPNVIETCDLTRDERQPVWGARKRPAPPSIRL